MLTDRDAIRIIWNIVKRNCCYECQDECEECIVGDLREWLNAKEKSIEKNQ